MPQYQFHIADGEPLRDDEGLEFASLDEARISAVVSLAEFVSHSPRDLLTHKSLQLVLTDEVGLSLMQIDMIVTDGPATMGLPSKI